MRVTLAAFSFRDIISVLMCMRCTAVVAATHEWTALNALINKLTVLKALWLN